MANNQRNDIHLEMPAADDFEGLAIMKDLAFAEKRGCSGSEEQQNDVLKAYRSYAQSSSAKLQHCRIVKEADGSVIGGWQLQLKDDAGDLSMPGFMRHELHHQGEAYIEWIACHPNRTGKGIGSKLLAWAESFAAENGASVLTLHVMKANNGAMRLYEKKGFELIQDPRQEACDCLFIGCVLYFCGGFKYWTVCYMEKTVGAKGAIVTETTNI